MNSVDGSRVCCSSGAFGALQGRHALFRAGVEGVDK